MQLQDYCTYTGNTIMDSIAVIQNCTSRCICVLNSKQKLIGVISQGDILRTLIDGVNPYSQIDSLLNPDFIYLNERDMKKAYKIMKEKGFTLLPVVDSEFHLTDIITIADVFRYIDSELSWEC